MTWDHNKTLPPKRPRFRFTVRQLLLAVLVAAVLLGFWIGCVRKIVAVRRVRNDDRVYERYFGIDRDATEIRNIAVVEGTFTKGTWLSASLFLIRSGKTQDVAALTIGRTTSSIGSPIWREMKITLALGQWNTTAGQITQLGSAGQTRGYGSDSDLPVNIPASFTNAWTGSISPGREYIIYAEGDTAIQMEPSMTLEEFAQTNIGNYLVVTAQLR